MTSANRASQRDQYQSGRPGLRIQRQGEGDIAGIVLDMGDVLFDATLWRRWLLRLLVRMGLNLNYERFYGTWDRDYLDDVHRGRREYGEALEAFLCASGLSRAQIDEVKAASRARRRELETELRPMPGVRTTLRRLRQSGIALAVLSDSEQPAAELARRLKRMGLGDVFHAIVSSVEIEHTKPEPICYQVVLILLRLPATRAVFVGHDAAELAGAAAVGMRTVAFNYEPGATADVYIDRFEELLDVVGCSSDRARAG